MPPGCHFTQHESTGLRFPVEHIMVDAGYMTTSEAQLVPEDQLEDSVSLSVPYPTSNLLSDGRRPLCSDQQVVYTMWDSATPSYKVETNAVRRAVVQRDDDVLTLQQLDVHLPEVEQAMLKELQTWAKLKCFSRRPLAGARNVIDTRWVNKFKWEESTFDTTKTGFQNTAATAK